METAKMYERDIKHYLNHRGEEKAKTGLYADVINYLESLVKSQPIRLAGMKIHEPKNGYCMGLRHITIT